MARTCVIVIALVLLSSFAAAQPAASEYELKAAFLLSFLKYVEWPPAASKGPLRVCLAGRNPFGKEVFEATFRGEVVNGRTVEPVELIEPDPSCHALFVAYNSNAAPYMRVALRNPTLTVGETETFLRDGGIIRFAPRDGKLRFEIDVEAAERAGLRIDPRLLRLRLAPEAVR